MPGDFEVSFYMYAVVRGFHVYQAIWIPTVGEALALLLLALATQREHGNPYAVAVTQHLPRSNYKVLGLIFLTGAGWHYI